MLVLAGIFMNSCASKETPQEKEEFAIDFEKYTLDNGLQVILHQDKSDPIVSVAIMYHVGSNREKPGRTGFAHFFEHMLFQDSENVGKGEFFRKIQELGGTFNGGTWTDGTVYYEVVPKDALEKILWMESDRMGFFINTVTESGLENEKKVVKNEKRERVDNQPYGHTNYVVLKTLYSQEHPYNWDVIGSLEDLQNATLDDVRSFYQNYYGPNNATMVIAGDFENGNVKDLVEKYFGEIAAKEKVEPIKPQPGVLKQTVKLFHEDNFAKLPELTLTYPTVESYHDDSYALDILGDLLTDGKRAALYKVLVDEKKLAPQPNAYHYAQELAGTFTIEARAFDGSDLDSVYQGVFTALQAFEKDGFADKDLERIKNLQETNFYNSISSVLGKSFQLAQYNVFAGDPSELTTDVKKVRAVTRDDVMRVYDLYIKNKNHIVTSFVPKGQLDLIVEGSTKAEVEEEEIVAGAQEDMVEEDTTRNFTRTASRIDRSKEPPLGGAPVISAPDIWTSKLANGMQVYGIESKELPLVQFSIRIMGGMYLDDPSKVGVANLITDMMMEGTKNKTPEQLEDAIGQLGANLNMYTSPEYITLSGNCLARNYDEVISLVNEILMEPRWDEKEFERIKQSTISTIQQRSADPNAVASRVYNRLLYGEDHILSHPTSGTIASVEAITLQDLKDYYAKYFSPSIANFHISGDLTQQNVLASLETMEKNWKAKEVSMPVYEAKPAAAKPQIYFVDVPDAKQSVIQVGSLTDIKGNDDYNAALVANYRLGSGSAGKLFQTLREEKGYTYGAYSYFDRKVDKSAFVASSSVKSDVTLESVEIFKDLINTYSDTYTQEELDKTKNTLIKNDSRNFETLGQRVGMLQNISTFNLPLDYVKKNQDAISQMSLADVKKTISQQMDPNKLVFLVVGDGKTQFDRLKDANLGDPVLLDKDGQPVNNPKEQMLKTQ